MRSLKRFAALVLLIPLLGACISTSATKIAGYDTDTFKKVLTLGICPDEQNGIRAELKAKDDQTAIIFLRYQKESFAMLLGERGKEKLFVEKDGDWQEASPETTERVIAKTVKAAEGCLDSIEHIRRGLF